VANQDEFMHGKALECAVRTRHFRIETANGRIVRFAGVMSGAALFAVHHKEIREILDR
jgi:hypothetical protein